jgi:hypothetical protein
MFQGLIPSLYAEDNDHDSTSESSSLDHNQTSDEPPLCLEGFLYFRRGHATSFSWKRRFVVLSMAEGGSLTVYKLSPEDNTSFHEPTATTVLRSVYKKPAKMAKNIQRRLSVIGGNSQQEVTELEPSENRQVDVSFASNVAWMAKDVLNDSSTFMVEILTENDDALEIDDEDGESDISSLYSLNEISSVTDNRPIAARSLGGRLVASLPISDAHSVTPLSVYFRCQKGKGSNEKALWLRAFDRMGRLSADIYKTRIIGTIAQKLAYYKKSRKRERNKSNVLFARHVRQLELDDDELSHTKHGIISKNSVLKQPTIEEVNFVHNDVEKMVHGFDVHTSMNKEYRVYPRYAYPHRWMTRQEMKEEMALTSEMFHDLRVVDPKQKEIGCLKVEVLQCFSLPKLERSSNTDAIVYLVCGQYAFTTDVIPNNSNPMWLRKSRRACEIPLFHAFAQLYVGVFDDDSSRVQDEFAGRVVLDLARLRPCSTYDVTLPLRLSSHVYSRRRRGAIRLRLSLRWNSERDALLSYIPNRIHIPLPQNSKPKTNVTVLCSDRKAFRNIAITVHGAHLPGKFTFHQMRAAIREINFTRKYIFTTVRLWIRETRHWHHPTLSAFVFFAWMHCIYANTFALVPAYAMSYFVLLLTKNYVKYGIDSPNNRGFIPPSWEELFVALMRGGDPTYRAIEPLELGLQANTLRQLEDINEVGEDVTVSLHNQDLSLDYKVRTHVPKGKLLFRCLGLLDNPDDAFVSAEDSHLEFPFADGDIAHYPKFTVKEALVGRSSESTDDKISELSAVPDVPSERRLVTNGKGEIRLIPRLSKRLEMEMPDLIRRDSSAMNDRDEEESKFNPRRAVVASGKHVISSVSKPTKRTVKDMKKTAMTATDMALTATGAGFTIAKTAAKSSLQAATTMAKTAGEFSEMTGLNHVVTPVTSTLQTGYHGVSTHFLAPMSRTSQKILRGGSSREHNVDDSLRSSQSKKAFRNSNYKTIAEGVEQNGLESDSSVKESLSSDSCPSSDDESARSKVQLESELPGVVGDVKAVVPHEPKIDGALSEFDEPDHVTRWPEQNVDIEGPSTGRKLTDDLQEIKDRVHDLTWHLFDDKIFVIKNPDALYFGQAKKPEKRRRKRNVDKDIEKLMQVGQYSHTNPFVARMGQYVEPIIGSAMSFLCLFRAGFNVVTWRDPMLTFWLSFFSGILAIVLFVFPWRLFLFGLGVFLVGPHLWLIRVLREKGFLPPAKKKRKRTEDKPETGIPSTQPVFTSQHREPGNNIEQPTDLDPREVHRIVIPYSPLIYNRFYDWPPEPQYAQVKRDAGYDSSMRRAAVLQSRLPKNLLRARAGSTDSRSRLRHRLRSRSSSWDSAALPTLTEMPTD